MTPNKAKALEALVTSRTLAEASQKSGVSERSLYSWLRDDSDFRGIYDRMRSESLQMVSDKVSQKVMDAIEVLVKIMQDPNISPSVRVRSAGIILDNYLRLSELTDFDLRLTAIEEKLKNDK